MSSQSMNAANATLSDWHRSGRQFRHRGHSVFYWEEGRADREVLLCMHGFPTASWDWHRVWPELASRWRVVAVDIIGYGFSDKPSRYPYSVHDQADLLQEILEALGVRRVHLLAHDVGVSVAQELLARYVERADDAGLSIASVCLLNGGLFPETHRPTMTQRILASRVGFLAGRLMTERKFGASFSEVFGASTKPTATELAEFWSLIAFNSGQRIAHKLIRYMIERRVYRQRWVGALHAKVPIRFINGADDPVSGAHMIRRLREELPEADVVMLPGIGHYPQIEGAAEVMRAYLKFRASLGNV
ncbi:MAG: alpha/beta hydrolase [Acidobacteriota bacterium]|nr:alpha/beta hydrolase [Acidobacteriota bacterium]